VFAPPFVLALVIELIFHRELFSHGHTGMEVKFLPASTDSGAQGRHPMTLLAPKATIAAETSAYDAPQ
jgi:hypothetical protein